MDLYTYLKALKMGRSGSLFEDLVAIKRKAGSIIKTEFAAIASFITKKAQKAIAVDVQLEPIQEGSGTPSPDNVRPISGRTECVTYVSGINVWDEEWEVGSFDGSGNPVATTTNIRSKNYIPIVPSANYYNYTGDNSWLTRLFYDTNKNYILTQSTRNGTFTAPPNALYMKFRTEGGVYGNTYNNDISINYPSTDHDYHAYNGTSYTTDLERTVYGGTLDVTTGVLTVDMAIVDLGTLAWTKLSDAAWNCFYSVSITNKAKNHNMICENYPVGMVYGTQNDKVIDGNTGSVAIYIRDSAYMSGDATAFKTAMNGVQLCYELATPQTYQLTPTEVALLKGHNNVWSDGGDISVTYVG